MDTLWKATEDGDVETVRDLLENSYEIDVNEFDDNDFNPLFYACLNQHIEIIHLLLNDSRCDINAQNRKGSTVLSICCQEGVTASVKLLLHHSTIQVNLGTEDGVGPLYLACAHGGAETVKILLKDSRVLVNQQTKEKLFPFLIACRDGKNDIVKLFLNDSRTDINCNSYGATSFYVACREGNREVVKELLKDDRVDINKPSKWGVTPLYIAAQNGTISVVKLILASKRFIETGTKWKGRTALEQAKNMKHNEIATLLQKYEAHSENLIFQLQKELGILDEKSSEIFVSMILFEDNFLKLNDSLSNSNNPYFRFLTIASKLPQELQMILSRRLFRLSTDFTKFITIQSSFQKVFDSGQD